MRETRDRLIEGTTEIGFQQQTFNLHLTPDRWSFTMGPDFNATKYTEATLKLGREVVMTRLRKRVHEAVSPWEGSIELITREQLDLDLSYHGAEENSVPLRFMSKEGQSVCSERTVLHGMPEVTFFGYDKEYRYEFITPTVELCLEETKE